MYTPDPVKTAAEPARLFQGASQCYRPREALHTPLGNAKGGTGKGTRGAPGACRDGSERRPVSPAMSGGSGLPPQPHQGRGDCTVTGFKAGSLTVISKGNPP